MLIEVVPQASRIFMCTAPTPNDGFIFTLVRIGGNKRVPHSPLLMDPTLRLRSSDRNTSTFVMTLWMVNRQFPDHEVIISDRGWSICRSASCRGCLAFKVTQMRRILKRTLMNGVVGIAEYTHPLLVRTLYDQRDFPHSGRPLEP